MSIVRQIRKFAFVATQTETARTAYQALTTEYGQVAPEEADIIVVLGGDGFMLESVHRYLHLKTPIFGLNCGTVGFLMNNMRVPDLISRVEKASLVELHPLRMRVRTETGETVEALAFNEVSLLRETRQAAKLRIYLDDVLRIEDLVCDGVMVATAAGSTAYNLSAHGPILPLGAEVLALTPISPFRPRRWRGAILPSKACIRIDIHHPEKRPVSAVADYTEVRDVRQVFISEDKDVTVGLLFDPEHHLEDRILAEQFLP